MPIRRRGTRGRRPQRRLTAEGDIRDGADGRDSFELQVQAALDGLPPAIARLLDNVAVVIAELPRPDQSAGADDPDGWLYGIYEGTPLTEWGADDVPFPNVITLFRVPLLEDFADPEELTRQIERTVVHELAHHAGIDDDRLRQLGYD